MRNVPPSVSLLLAAALTAGCGVDSSGARVTPDQPATQSPTSTRAPFTASPTTVARLEKDDKYAAAIDMFARRKLDVWVETDLVQRWLEGQASFEDAVSRVAALARRPGVVGIKIADELGYHDGMTDAAQVQAFLDDVAAALRPMVPHTKILVDMVVPDLGCLPWLAARLPETARCAADERAAAPAASMAAVDAYLASGNIDVLDLSTGLREPYEYVSWGMSQTQAQREAWAETRRRGWPTQVTLQARKALAHPGDYSGDAVTAATDLRTFVDIPVEAGARAVDVWTWRQLYDGQVVRLLDPGLYRNDLWEALLARRRSGVHMLTHYTPSSVEVSPTVDSTWISEVFTGVFVAAGTG